MLKGCAQVSLADFNTQTVSQKWYNILSLLVMEPNDDVTSTGKSTHKQQESDLSLYRDKETDIRHQVGLKEESSDDSTIISSQTSTLTRNQDSESFQPMLVLNFDDLENCLQNTEDYDSDDTEDDEEDDGDEEGITVEFRPNEKLEMVPEDCDEHDDENRYSDKQTNTECAFYPEHAKQMKLVASGMVPVMDDRGAIKRSQTFSPSAAVSKNQYTCKLNRSDSDSAMPLYRRGGDPFQRNAVERRSLRFRRQSGSMLALATSKTHSHLPITARTSLDLELDLHAQHTRLDVLNSELNRLRELKQRLEKAKEQGDTELAAWVLEDQQFQNLVSEAECTKNNKTPEEKKVEKMLRKVSKEIYKLRKTKVGNGKPDLISFK